MPEEERIAIHKRFLKNFCDVLVETGEIDLDRSPPR